MNTSTADRKTVAVLVDYMNLFADGYEMEFRRLFERVCEAKDLNLMFVYGRAIAHPAPGSLAHNKIYELLGPKRIDGLIALSSSITSFCGLEGARAFFSRYRSLFAALGWRCRGCPVSRSIAARVWTRCWTT